MKVIATAMGIYESRRIRVGEVFDVPEGHHAKWFQPAKANANAQPETPQGKPLSPATPRDPGPPVFKPAPALQNPATRDKVKGDPLVPHRSKQPREDDLI